MTTFVTHRGLYRYIRLMFVRKLGRFRDWCIVKPPTTAKETCAVEEKAKLANECCQIPFFSKHRDGKKRNLVIFPRA